MARLHFSLFCFALLALQLAADEVGGSVLWGLSVCHPCPLMLGKQQQQQRLARRGCRNSSSSGRLPTDANRQIAVGL
jgi:hypothetical protein